jgi:hypothetical protein
MGDEGLESSPKNSERIAASQQSGAYSGAFSDAAVSDLDLARIVAGWNTLSPAARAAMLAIMEGGSDAPD